MLADLWLLTGALFPVFALVGLGFLTRRFRLVTDQGVEDLNRLVFWVVLPAQLFVLVSAADLRQHFDGSALAAAMIGFIGGLTGSWLASGSLPPALRGTVVSGVARPNAAFIGLPVIQLLSLTMPVESGRAMLAAYGVLLGFMIAAFNIGSVMALLLSHHGLSRRGLLQVAEHVVRNPLIIACALGVTASLIRPGLLVATMPGATVALLATAAIPMSLLLTGMQLDLGLVRRTPGLLALGALCKLVLVPALTWAAGMALGVEPLALTAAVVLMACPVAVASVPMARMLGGDAELMAALVVLTTVAAPVAMLGWLLVLR
jgi:predicted permease